jgi:hypothetical protein
LYFVSDRTDWWNLYAERDGKIVPVLPMEAEFGAPQWVFGTTTYGFESSGQIVARYSQRGTWRIMRIDPRTGQHQTLELPYSHISAVTVTGDRVYLVAGAPAEHESLVEFDLAKGVRHVIRRASPLEPDPA